MSSCKYTAATLHFLKFAANRTDFMRFTRHAKLISASKGKVQVEMEVLPEMVGDSGEIAPGCLYTIFDTLSIVAAYNKYQGVPATVAAQVHYFAPVKLGDILRIDTQMLHRMGAHNQVYAEAQFHSVENNCLVAKGGQTFVFPGGKGQQVEGLPQLEFQDNGNK